MLPVAAVLIDIEGTTTPSAFVRDVLFPYARERLPALVSDRASEPAVAAELQHVRIAAPGKPVIDTLLHWMDADLAVTPLKVLQSIIFHDGYEDGTLKGDVYPDVPEALRAWNAAGIRLYGFSVGSVAAQKLLFGHSVAGDLVSVFTGFFDTRVGSKREAESYGRLAIGLALPPPEVLYLSAVDEELDAAAAAGLRTCRLARDPEAREAEHGRHAVAPDFRSVAAIMALPGGR